jgi:hypothetical protein
MFYITQMASSIYGQYLLVIFISSLKDDFNYVEYLDDRP